MDLLIARRVFLNNPTTHVDVGSSTQGFVAHVASYREIEIFDIRSNDAKVKNITFKQADFSNPVALPANYTDSLSCLHAIEHFGLGRYNDPLDPDGHLKGLDNMYKLIKPGGKFYFATPIGPQRIEFNAHRVFSVGYLLNIFKDKYKLEQFSYVDDKGVLFENITLTDEIIHNSCGCHYGCGIFEMIKL
jgi:SAM-dependent methyltransferase